MGVTTAVGSFARYIVQSIGITFDGRGADGQGPVPAQPILDADAHRQPEFYTQMVIPSKIIGTPETIQTQAKKQVWGPVLPKFLTPVVQEMILKKQVGIQKTPPEGGLSLCRKYVKAFVIGTLEATRTQAPTHTQGLAQVFSDEELSTNGVIF